jgi:adenosylmethionine-8-amino-7-oxononanoate aminotransferase
LAAAAAVTSLEVFNEEQTLVRMRPKVELLEQHLERIGQLRHVGNTRSCGLMAGIELVRDRATREPYPWIEQRGKQVCDYALTQGVWLRPLGNVVVIMPPLAISVDELDLICDVVRRGIESVTR